jgi:hypothetical protein
MLRHAKSILACLTLILAASASASAYKDLQRLIEGRAQQYTERRPALEQRTQQSAAIAVRSIQTIEPSAAQALDTALADTRQLSYLYGRYQTLWALRQHMEKKPPLAASEVWLQQQVAAIKAKMAAADSAENDVRRTAPGKDVPLITWVGAIERLAQDRGYNEGAVAELSLINEDLRAYYAARAEEHERAVRLRTALLIALAATLSSQQAETRDLGVDSVANGVTICPDGTYVGGKTCNMTPNGRYVGGTPQMTPNGDYVGGKPRIAPDGSYVGGSGKVTMCPDGTYVGGACKMTPRGTYVGN